KDKVYVAIAHETAELLLKQRMYRAGMSRPARDMVRVLIVMSPFLVRGLVHVPPRSDITRLSRSSGARFFPVTDGSVFWAGKAILEEPILCLNSQAIAASHAMTGTESWLEDAENTDPAADPGPGTS